MKHAGNFENIVVGPLNSTNQFLQTVYLSSDFFNFSPKLQIAENFPDCSSFLF